MIDSDKDKEFLEFLVKSIVDHPDDVEIERKIDEMGVLLTLKVNQEDMGQIIGRSGSTAKAIRSLLKIVGLKNNARINLKILEPEGSTRTFNKESEAPSSSPVDDAVEELKQDL